MLQPYRRPISYYVALTLVLLIPCVFIANLLSGLVTYLPQNIFLNYLRSLGFFETPTAVSLIIGFVMLVDRILWKFCPRAFGIINAEGRYEGELQSSYDETRRYPVVIEIKQTLSDICISLFTANSSSYSGVASIGKNPHGNWTLHYIYCNNTATVHNDTDMKNHEGVAMLEIFDSGKAIEGYYFNNPRDRGRYGQMKLKFVSKKMRGHF